MATTQSTNNHQDHQLIISNKTKANKQSTSAKSNLYYYHDQHSLHNNDVLQITEHEQYCTAPQSQSSSLNLHTNTANKSPSHNNSFPHTTFHSQPKKSNNNHLPTSSNTTISSVSSANTLSTLNPSEVETKHMKKFTQNSNGKSNKGLQKNGVKTTTTNINNDNINNNDDSVSSNKLYGELTEDYKVDNSDICDSYSEVLTSHYYLSNKKLIEDRKAKKAKR
jgi:hypothetical protein